MIARIFAALLLLPGLAFGAAVVDGGGGTISAEEAEAAAAAVGASEGAPLTLESSAGAWLVAGGALGPERTGNTVALSEQLAQAREKLANLETTDALALLRQAVSSLPSSSAAVDPIDLTATLELLGMAAQDEGADDVARAAYRQLLATSPAYRLHTPPGMGYEELFADVRNAVNALPRPTLAVRHAREDVRWDGKPVEARWSGSEPTTPGRHLLQWSDGLGWQGAWVDVAEDAVGVVLLATDGSIEELLAEGATDEGHRAALVGWLGPMDPDAVLVVTGRGPLRGYRVAEGQVSAWSAAAQAGSQAAAPKAGPAGLDVVRLGIGGGYMLVDGSSYGDVTASLDLRLIGPLSLHVDADLGISEPLDFGPDHPLTGRFTVLPGVGVGVNLRAPKGPVQPFGQVSLGLWIVPAEQRAEAEEEASRLDSALGEHLGSRTPVGFRGYLDGGVDLLPPGPLLVRVAAGIGYGYGFQVRAGAQVGFRFGGAS